MITNVFRRYTLVLALILAVALFSILRPDVFPTLPNARSILVGNAALVLIALGGMIPLIVNQFDLTPAYMATMGGLIVAGLQSFWSVPWPLAVALTLVFAVMVGLLNGVLVSYLRLSSIIVTIGTGALLMGAALIYSDNLIIFKGISEQFIQLGRGDLIGIPLPVIYAAIVALALWYFLSYRTTGRFLYAIGANEEAARLVKIRVKLLTLGSFVASAVLTSLGGVIVTAQVGSASPSSLNYLLLPAFTAVFLGATSIRPGHYNVWGTVIAVYLVGSVTTGMFMLGAPSNVAQVVQGAILLLAVALAKLTERRAVRRDST